MILFFDKADALFGNRREIRDVRDRFANTDTSYLIEGIENYQGMALLATNKKGNVDTAFMHRLRYCWRFGNQTQVSAYASGGTRKIKMKNEKSVRP